ncbi:chromate efflux transporter [Prosthecomicrobium pneumaticum]|uniref:Chromate transporter n=1 Tax=Prosthecomicrobium pneumaticum TaxID=81895 RepID=A0A7W9CVN1_9HYPH|nr:chromate efflux transporter [Prosthecomicrobium pneumaticum]MBB5752376.1 chromate transporter [Prosthecomicrobium pneumaticum]
MNEAPSPIVGRQSPAAIFAVFLALGLTSFGGPVAHLGFFREALVRRRRWLDDAAYAELVALCQILPGPASSQVGMGIGLLKGGLAGAVAAFLGFTLPSALVMAALGLGLVASGRPIDAGLLHGLEIAVAAVVLQAVVAMARQLTPDGPRRTLAALAAVALLLLPFAAVQLVVLATAGVLGALLLPASGGAGGSGQRSPLGPRAGAALLALFFGLLVGLPVLAAASGSEALRLAGAFYRSGSLVFGGGHVVLPLLDRAVVGTGFVAPDVFVAGYGAAQAVPGPLFSFASYLGAAAAVPNGPLGALLATLAIFLPAFLLVCGALPFWGRLLGLPAVRPALAGINAAVVGLLAAALADPVGTHAIRAWWDVPLVAAAFLLLMKGLLPPWLLVPGAGLAGWIAAGLIGAF